MVFLLRYFTYCDLALALRKAWARGFSAEATPHVTCLRRACRKVRPTSLVLDAVLWGASSGLHPRVPPSCTAAAIPMLQMPHATGQGKRGLCMLRTCHSVIMSTEPRIPPVPMHGLWPIGLYLLHSSLPSCSVAAHSTDAHSSPAPQPPPCCQGLSFMCSMPAPTCQHHVFPPSTVQGKAVLPEKKHMSAVLRCVPYAGTAAGSPPGSTSRISSSPPPAPGASPSGPPVPAGWAPSPAAPCSLGCSSLHAWG